MSTSRRPECKQGKAGAGSLITSRCTAGATGPCLQRRGRRRRSTKRPTKTTTATLSFQDSTNRPYGMITSSFQYQLDGLLTRRGFEVNRRSISQLANRDVEKAHRLIGKAHWQRRSRPSLYSAGGVMVRVRWCGCVGAGALVGAGVGACERTGHE